MAVLTDKHFVYELIDPRTLQVRYIGCSSNPKARLAYHWSQPASKAMKIWISELRAIKKKPIIRIVREFDSFQEAVEFEEKYIPEMSEKLGTILLNSLARLSFGECARKEPPGPKKRQSRLTRNVYQSLRIQSEQWSDESIAARELRSQVAEPPNTPTAKRSQRTLGFDTEGTE